MSQQVNLDGAPLGLKALREQSRLELQELLDGLPGRKLLVLDETLTGPLGLVVEVSVLKARGVEKIYHLLPEPLETDCEHVVYMVRPKLALMGAIASQVRGGARRPGARHTVVFVPQRSMICEKALEEAGVYDLVSVAEFGMDVVPLDTDLLSLESTDCFADLHVHSDHLCLLQLARTLVKLQAAHCAFGSVRGKGEAAKAVVDLMASMQGVLDASAAASGAPPPPADARAAGLPAVSLVVLDRRVDLVSPLLTQLTYEGMLDETFGISASFIDIDARLLAPDEPAGVPAPQPAAAGRRAKVCLNSSDSLHAELRGLGYGALHGALRAKAEAIKAGYEARHAAQTVSQMRGFMRTLGTMQQQHKSLATHVSLAQALAARVGRGSFLRQLELEQALLAHGGESGLLGGAAGGGALEACAEFAEELIGRAEPLARVLRLLCLMSAVGNGLRQRQLAFFRAELLQTYGYALGGTLDRLEALRLLHRNEARSGWPSLRAALRLCVDDAGGSGEGAEPDDVAYVFSGCVRPCVGWRPRGCSRRAPPHRHTALTPVPPAPPPPSALRPRPCAGTRPSQSGSCSRRPRGRGSGWRTRCACCPGRSSSSSSR